MTTERDKRGADHRRSIYGYSRDYKAEQIRAEAHKRAKAALQRSAGKSLGEQRGAQGEVMAILLEAQANLDRLERGRTDAP